MFGGSVEVWTKNILQWSMRVKLILACQNVLEWAWSSMNWNRLLFFRIQTLPPSMHHKWKGNPTNGNILRDQLQDNSSIELQEKLNMILIIYIWHYILKFAPDHHVCWYMQSGSHLWVERLDFMNQARLFWSIFTQIIKRALLWYL